jgi:hypothetical protein
MAFTLLQPEPTTQTKTVTLTVSDVGSMSNFKYQVTLVDANLGNMADYHIAMTGAGFNPVRNQSGTTVSVTLDHVDLVSLLVRSILDDYIGKKKATWGCMYHNRFATSLDLDSYEVHVQEKEFEGATVYHIEFNV